jgi:hypothetical protein
MREQGVMKRHFIDIRGVAQEELQIWIFLDLQGGLAVT